MLVRSVKSHGHFRWKKHDVFLSEVLWGERVGLLPVDDEKLHDLFCPHAAARFDSRLLRVVPAAESCNRSQNTSSGGACPRRMNNQKPSDKGKTVNDVPGLKCQRSAGRSPVQTGHIPDRLERSLSTSFGIRR